MRSFGWFENDCSIFITMEYLPLGDLETRLQAPLPEDQARVITRQVLQGLVFMHQNKFAHRDLKPGVSTYLGRVFFRTLCTSDTLLSRISLSSMRARDGGSRYQTSVSASRSTTRPSTHGSAPRLTSHLKSVGSSRPGKRRMKPSLSPSISGRWVQSSSAWLPVGWYSTAPWSFPDMLPPRSLSRSTAPWVRIAPPSSPGP